MVKYFPAVVLLGLLASWLHADESDFQCKENVPYILDGHFPCQCEVELNNTLTCDLSHCPEKPFAKSNCTLGTTWKDKCNDCYCRIIGVVCTSLDCTEKAGNQL